MIYFVWFILIVDLHANCLIYMYIVYVYLSLLCSTVNFLPAPVDPKLPFKYYDSLTYDLDFAIGPACYCFYT